MEWMYVAPTRGTRIYRVLSCKPLHRIGESLGDHASPRIVPNAFHKHPSEHVTDNPGVYHDGIYSLIHSRSGEMELDLAPVLPCGWVKSTIAT